MSAKRLKSKQSELPPTNQENEEQPIPLSDPSFQLQVFAQILKKTGAGIREQLSPLLVEGIDVLHLAEVRQVVQKVIDQEGQIAEEELDSQIARLQGDSYPLGPYASLQAVRQAHLLQGLLLLKQEKACRLALKAIATPYANRLAESYIRETMNLSLADKIDDGWTRRAALAAWLTYFRQSVGSCFATAPALLIQGEQPLQLLKDLQELLATGQLRRVFQGNEYSVPLSFSSGAGSFSKPLPFEFVQKLQKLQDPLQLKAFLVLFFIPLLESLGLLAEESSLFEKEAKGQALLIFALKRVNIESLTVEKLATFLLLREHHVSLTAFLAFKEKMEGNSALPAFGLLGQVAPSLKKEEVLFEKILKVLMLARSQYNRLSENALLRAWEYTLASFSESQSSLARWNLYASLGFEKEEEGGIGSCLYESINERVENFKRQMASYQEEYDALYVLIRSLETRLNTSNSEKDVEWLKADYRLKVQQADHLALLQRQAANKGQRLADSYHHLTDLYLQKFPDYFQEVYDPDIKTEAKTIVDDSPAGFRLLYKHGRKNPSLWSKINSPQEYSEALASFFTAVEVDFSSLETFAGLEEELSQLTTSLVSHVRTPFFLETALGRMAKAHGQRLIKNPLDHLNQIEKKPWIYTSGGTMNHLIACYFRLIDKPKEVAKWVENVDELLIFFIESLKNLPAKTQKLFPKQSLKSLLMHSPTHAFLLKPGLSFFHDAWNSDLYSTSWIGQHLVRPQQRFLEEVHLSPEMMRYLLAALNQKFPADAGNELPEPPSYSLSPIQFRKWAIELQGSHLSSVKGHLSATIDGLLFSCLPFIEVKKGKAALLSIFSELQEHLPEGALGWLSAYLEQSGLSDRDFPFGVISALQLKKMALGLLCLYFKRPTDAFAWNQLILDKMRRLKLALPAPLFFADTNWPSYYFAFLVSPGSGALELWMVDFAEEEGRPMSEWRQWLDGSERQSFWTLYTDVHEYTS